MAILIIFVSVEWIIKRISHRENNHYNKMPTYIYISTLVGYDRLLEIDFEVDISKTKMIEKLILWYFRGRCLWFNVRGFRCYLYGIEILPLPSVTKYTSKMYWARYAIKAKHHVWGSSGREFSLSHKIG